MSFGYEYLVGKLLKHDDVCFAISKNSFLYILWKISDSYVMTIFSSRGIRKWCFDKVKNIPFVIGELRYSHKHNTVSLIVDRVETEYKLDETDKLISHIYKLAEECVTKHTNTGC